MNDSMPGDQWVLAGRYRVDALIGDGGMGTVWSGYDQQLDRRVAIKLMHPVTAPAARAGSTEAEALAEEVALARERFLREIRTTARLELPGIPAVYDFGVEESTGRIFLVMQLLYGRTLADLTTSREADDPWPVSWAAATAAQVAATLVDVHAVDVVHRDIKPSNLMVNTGGLVKVLDFGVAILQGASALPRLTRIGATVGSPPYMPPEQVLGNPVVPASDVYALGCVLHEIVTGQVPFQETAARSYQDHHVNTPAAAMRTLRPDLPAELDQLVLAMLAKSSGDRPSAEAVYDALLPLARSGPPPSGEERDPRRPFLRPLAPGPRPRTTPPAARTPAAGQPPLTVEEALDIHQRVAHLVQDAQLQHAIDLLDTAVARAAHNPALRQELAIELAETLFMADEYTRAAAAFDTVLPDLDTDSDPETALLWYHAGVSHAETGNVEPAIGYLTTYLAAADPADALYRDALFQLGTMLPVIGHVEDGLRHLHQLRPLLVTEYGPESIHVTSLDRRIHQIRQRHS